MSEKNFYATRLRVPNGDESVIAWLKKQDNVSVSLRLLIKNEIRRAGKIEDYLLHDDVTFASPVQVSQPPVQTEPVINTPMEQTSNKNETNVQQKSNQSETRQTEPSFLGDDVLKGL